MSVTAKLSEPFVRKTGGRAPEYWRSLEGRDGSPAGADRPEAGIDRRGLLKLMGAAFALTIPPDCARAASIMPYVRQPEDAIAGDLLHYATTLDADGFGIGALVTSYQGRPIKVEGNPDHPASLGATDAIMQAACVSLYDPNRSDVPRRKGQPVGLDRLLADIAELRQRLQAVRGRGFALLTGPVTSPTLLDQIAALRSAYPEMRWRVHDPLAAPGEGDGLAALHDQRLATRYAIDRADLIVSLDGDFLGEGPGKLAHARAFASRRILRDGARRMNRLYVFEPAMSVTGAAADRRHAVRPSEVPGIAAKLAASIASGEANSGPVLETLAGELRAAGPAALVIAGPRQPAEVHRDVYSINAALGSNAVDYVRPLASQPDDGGDLATLVNEIGAGAIDTLLIFDGNPVYSSGGDIDLAKALAAVRTTIHWGAYVDETASLCTWHVPASIELEDWSDRRAFDGTASIVQPLILPLKGGRSAHELLAAFLGDFQSMSRDIVRRYWQQHGLSDSAWEQVLRTGTIPGTRAEPVALVLTRGAAPGVAPVEQPSGPSIELRFEPDPWLRAGKNANNAWLQELPRPLTKQIWDNAARLSPATAAAHGLASGDIVEITRDGRTVAIPVFIDPGHAADCVTLTLGFGRRAGAVAAGVGIDVFPLRTAGEWTVAGTAIRKAGRRGRVVTTQEHQTMEGRDIVRSATLGAYLAGDSVGGHKSDPKSSLYPAWPYPKEAWGMVIDQTACIGCMACVSACQAENNIPSVGIDECAVGHEMHWLRVDRYYSGSADDPHVAFQPVPCMQCEDAPCEVVCPVNATVHTHDGLNAQVYNRCVGTRYCSQNCPYKVRRFNFLEYQDFPPGAPLAPLMNPDVTVRSRGTMEKCTYCVQRISRARISADIADGEIPDGAVTPACAQACPTKAIVFGDLNRPGSDVSRLRDHPLNYTLLAELNTRPRTTYLARIINPSGEGKDDHG
jgi:molybdopterin-containing oxidoreductase family iron-sulfur binding subunit